ncbi:hypothetical protein [Abiotrophia defectiva]|uniref:Uncharacterized protein n=1 Tax=Abiotrophia defectiva ATCC 49176 TaxID=592010 RepID=W1Q3M3_ABIDE|nr:hypothetical protein [Abiotrophia defectiva]ESK65777.1 hypothetical protein GCWU000182_00842 [Abiotrophia defectiva ATCC 49176]QKH46752.1 hypothetical protein FOC79_03550 [Abiotrophia defectiva]
MVGIVMNAKVQVENKKEFSILKKLLSSADEKINIEQVIHGEGSRKIVVKRDSDVKR